MNDTLRAFLNCLELQTVSKTRPPSPKKLCLAEEEKQLNFKTLSMQRNRLFNSTEEKHKTSVFVKTKWPRTDWALPVETWVDTHQNMINNICHATVKQLTVTPYMTTQSYDTFEMNSWEYDLYWIFKDTEVINWLYQDIQKLNFRASRSVQSWQ